MQANNFRKSILLSLLALVLGCFALGLVCFRKHRSLQSEDCVKIEVSFFPFSYRPLIKINIQDTDYRIMLDTGSSHTLDLHARVLKQIQGKKFTRTNLYYDLQGKKHPVSEFLLPEIVLHKNLRFSHLPAHEENINFLTKDVMAGRIRSTFGKIKSKLGLFLIDGRAGWTLMESVSCLFDFSQSSLFIAKNLAAMQKEGIFTPEHFIKVPLELCKCGPVLVLQTEEGMKKFLLDTGSPCSVYRQSDEQTVKERVLTLTLDNHSLGHWDFWSYPITTSLEIDGILGIDFFKTRAICFDFPEKTIYVHKTKKNPTILQSFLTFFAL